MRNMMFCYQCQETALGKRCVKYGVCGKGPDVAAMQDLLLYVTKGLSCITTRLREEDKCVSREINHLITRNLSSTITNTNFDKKVLAKYVVDTVFAKEALLPQISVTNDLPKAAFWTIESGWDEKNGLSVIAEENEDIRSLKETITYGLKGLASCMESANALSEEDEVIDAFIQRALSKTLDETISTVELLKLMLETGKFGLFGMDLLSGAKTKKYGAPVITCVSTGVRKKPGILVSGHDFHDLEMLLEQSKNAGVDIYTHAEMLPAQYYPRLKKHAHLACNYGGSWRGQKEDFERFHGPVLMTTGCVIPPNMTYKNRLWTTGTVSIPGCRHIYDEFDGKKDFSEIIAQAGKYAPPEKIEGGSIIGGFGHEQFLSVSDMITKAVIKGMISKFAVIFGCDGRMKTRQYYTDLAKALPKDVVILTAGCVKYRFIKLNLEDVGGIPRVFDVGQCTDFYSLLQIVRRLQELLGEEEINNLPIVYNISWLEQKTIITLLAMLAMGIKNIHFGPSMPAFFSPAVLEILKKNYGITGIGTAEEDLKRFFWQEDDGTL